MTNDLIAELSRLHHRATDLRAREAQLADAGENDPASDTWKTAAIVAASAECEFHAALVTAWPTISRVLREAAEGGWRPIDDQARNGEEWMLTAHKYKNPSKGRWYCNGWWDGECFRTDDGEELHRPDFYAPIIPPPPATETTKTEEPRHD